jgi:hypothetical protein
MNTSIDLLIVTWNYIKLFIMKIIAWFFINKKTHLLVVMDFWSPKMSQPHFGQV